MKVMQRLAATAVALALGMAASAPSVEAQTRTVNPQAPRLLVVVFTSNERPAGVEVSDAIRTQILRGISPRQLTVIAKEQITTFLESSGYKPDSALGQVDLEALARILRANEVIAGRVTRTGSSYRIEPRLMLARDVTIAQPLPVQEGGNLGQLARQIERTYEDARKQLEDNQACENGIRDRQFDRAIAEARKAIAKYEGATIGRLCMASAYQARMQSEEGAARLATADSILMITQEVRRLDPRSTIAPRLGYAAYQAKGDQENAVRMLVSLLDIERNNTTLQQQVVQELAQLGKPEVALPIIDTLVARNPGDPQFLRQRWLLLLASAAADTVPESRARYFAMAVQAGETMVRQDTTLADSTYFERQIAAATGVTDNPQRSVEITARATQKFPQSAVFWQQKAQAERRAGQLQMAEQSIKRAISLNPTLPNGRLLLATIYLETNQLDSAVAVARRAATAGEDKATWGTFLLQPTQASWRYADSVKTVPAYKRALAISLVSDSLAPSATAKFFAGVSSFYIAANGLQDAQKGKSCALAREAQDMLVITQMNMPAGGSIDANTARTVLGLVAQYLPAAEQMVKQYCK